MAIVIIITVIIRTKVIIITGCQRFLVGFVGRLGIITIILITTTTTLIVNSNIYNIYNNNRESSSQIQLV